MRKKIAASTLFLLIGICALGADSPRVMAGHGFIVQALWSPNSEPDVTHYLINLGQKSGEYSYTFEAADTAAVIILPKEWKTDSVFATVQAVDSAGNVSGHSNEVRFIPEVIDIDYADDANKRIDVKDLNAFLRLYNRYFAKSTQKTEAK